MKTITIQLYEYDELPTEKAKEKAREWFAEGAFDYDWWDFVYDNAENVGIKIEKFDGYRGIIEGKFLSSAEETAHKIEKGHGESCDTFKTAKAYLKQRDETIEQMPVGYEGYELDEKLDALDAEFLHDILQDYLSSLRKEAEYMESKESIEESIRINEYTFRENGKREG